MRYFEVVYCLEINGDIVVLWHLISRYTLLSYMDDYVDIQNNLSEYVRWSYDQMAKVFRCVDEGEACCGSFHLGGCDVNLKGQPY